MIPEKDMKKIKLAVNGYINMSNFLSESEEVPEQSFPLGDRCRVGDNDYTVKQLLEEMQSGSEVGLQVAQEVYQRVQENKPVLEEMVTVGAQNNAILFMGRTPVPTKVFIKTIAQTVDKIPEAQMAFELLNYAIALGRVIKDYKI